MYLKDAAAFEKLFAELRLTIRESDPPEAKPEIYHRRYMRDDD